MAGWLSNIGQNYMMKAYTNALQQNTAAQQTAQPVTTTPQTAQPAAQQQQNISPYLQALLGMFSGGGQTTQQQQPAAQQQQQAAPTGQPYYSYSNPGAQSYISQYGTYNMPMSSYGYASMPQKAYMQSAFIPQYGNSPGVYSSPQYGVYSSPQYSAQYFSAPY